MTRPMTSPCCSGFRSAAQRESSCRRRRDRTRSVALRGIPYDHSDDAPRQNDLEVVAVLHVRHDKCENESDRQTKHDSQEQGIYFAREKSDRDTGDQTFDRRAYDDAGELRPHRRREPRRSSIDCAKNRTQQESEQNFVHGRPPLWPRFSPCSRFFTTAGKFPLGLTMRNQKKEDPQHQTTCYKQNK